MSTKWGRLQTSAGGTAEESITIKRNATLSISGGNLDGSGTFTATCGDARDNAGNPGTGSVSYAVVYPFAGFHSPVANLPIFNLVTSGRAIPAKFGLGRDRGLDILATGYPRSEQIACDESALVNGVDETSTSGNSSVQYDAVTDTYTYTWSTQRSWRNGCRQLVVKLVDGSYHRANFQFR